MTGTVLQLASTWVVLAGSPAFRVRVDRGECEDGAGVASPTRQPLPLALLPVGSMLSGGAQTSHANQLIQEWTADDRGAVARFASTLLEPQASPWALSLFHPEALAPIFGACRPSAAELSVLFGRYHLASGAPFGEGPEALCAFLGEWAAWEWGDGDKGDIRSKVTSCILGDATPLIERLATLKGHPQ